MKTTQWRIWLQIAALVMGLTICGHADDFEARIQEHEAGARNGDIRALHYLLDALVYRADSEIRADPQRAYEFLSEWLKDRRQNPQGNESDRFWDRYENQLRILRMAASVGPFEDHQGAAGWRYRHIQQAVMNHLQEFTRWLIARSHADLPYPLRELGEANEELALMLHQLHEIIGEGALRDSMGADITRATIAETQSLWEDMRDQLHILLNVLHGPDYADAWIARLTARRTVDLGETFDIALWLVNMGNRMIPAGVPIPTIPPLQDYQTPMY